MRVKMEARCGMTEIFNDGMWDENTSAGAGFAYFDRQDAEKF